MLTDIQGCARKSHETPERFANRFNGTIARYKVQCGKLDASMGRQFAVLMLCNTGLSENTFNAQKFNLTMMAQSSEKRQKVVRLARID